MGRREPELLRGGETEVGIEGADDPARPQLVSGRAGTLTRRGQIPLGHLPAELARSHSRLMQGPQGGAALWSFAGRAWTPGARHSGRPALALVAALPLPQTQVLSL